MFGRLRQFKSLGMVHLKDIAVLHPFDLERRRRLCLGIALATATTRSQQAQNQDEKQARMPETLRFMGSPHVQPRD